MRITRDTPLLHWCHQLIDRDKPMTGTDILAVGIDGDGLKVVQESNLGEIPHPWRPANLSMLKTSTATGEKI